MSPASYCPIFLIPFIIHLLEKVVPTYRISTSLHPTLFSLVFVFFFKINLFILFIYFWLLWVFVAARGLPLVAVSGGYSSLRCTGFSLR